MHPSDEADAVFARVRFIAKAQYLLGSSEYCFEGHSYGNVRIAIQGHSYFVRMHLYLIQNIRPIKMLAAGDKPYFVVLNINHRSGCTSVQEVFGESLLSLSEYFLRQSPNSARNMLSRNGINKGYSDN